MPDIVDNGGMLDLGIMLLAALGGLNQGLVEVMNYNIFVDLLALSTETKTVALGAIGIAGALVAIQTVRQELM